MRQLKPKVKEERDDFAALEQKSACAGIFRPFNMPDAAES